MTQQTLTDTEQSLREGRLQDALTRLQAQVRQEPANVGQRVFLFQLLAVLGRWERALNQLQVLGELDAATLAMVQTYREALRCEVFREAVFAGRCAPLVLGEPAQWLALLLEALRLTAQGRHGEAQALREQAFAAAPATPGTLDQQPFAWIADADMRLGPVLEAIVNGQYYWIPFQHIRALRLEPPADLRDLVWLPARFTWSNGGESVGLIPSRYPGSYASADAQIQLARKTEWVACENELYSGLGQRMLATDTGEYPLLDSRLLTLDALEAAAADGAGGTRHGRADS